MTLSASVAHVVAAFTDDTPLGAKMETALREKTHRRMARI
jgi:hypothetical protein